MSNKESYLLEYLNRSFLGSIKLEEYTDITYNGEFLYGVSKIKKKKN